MPSNAIQSLQPREIDELTAPRGLLPAAVEGLARTPQAHRVEPRSDHVRLGMRDSGDLAQHLVRVVAELEHIAEQDQVAALLLTISSARKSARIVEPRRRRWTSRANATVERHRDWRAESRAGTIPAGSALKPNTSATA